MTKPFHPSDAINQHLLREVSSATVAVTHDSQWAMSLDKGLLNLEELSLEDRLLAAVKSNYSTALANEDAVYLRGDDKDETVIMSTSSKGRTDVSSCNTPTPHLFDADSQSVISAGFLGLFRKHRLSIPAPSAGATGQASRAMDRDHERFPAELAPRDRSRQPQTINVIVFGEAGVGKSAVINLIAQRQIAGVTSDVDSCTMTSTPYDVAFDGLQFRIFDTAGLNEPHFPSKSHQDVIVKMFELIQQLKVAGGIHLLLFCIRRGKITLTTQNNYKLFAEFFCQRRVPVGVVVTNCEHEPNMEDWWTRNSAGIEHYGIRSNGHAWVTAVTDSTPAENAKYRDSQRQARELLKRCYLKTGAFLLDETDWLAAVRQGLKSLVKKGETLRKRDTEKALRRLSLPPAEHQEGP